VSEWAIQCAASFMRHNAEDIARLFCVGFDGLVPSTELRELLKRGVGAVIFFSRNIESAGQFADLCGQVKRLAGRPIVTCIDQEGGRVARLREGFTAIPPMREIGRTGNVRRAEAIGRVLAAELRAVNIDLDFAPVLDVDTNPLNPVIGDRSFGPDPELVGAMGCALLRAMQAGGVAGCGKHFPGHGDTLLDSHLDLPRLPHDMARLNRVELPPFRRAIAAGVASIMTAHVIFDALDPGRPSTLSRAVIGGLLRQELRYDGVVVSDDLEMKAISDHFPPEEAVPDCINAGADMVMICHTPQVQHRGIDSAIEAVQKGRIAHERIAEALRRLDRLARQYVRPGAQNP
jgi:beta-N-acetylhexosaminidase